MLVGCTAGSTTPAPAAATASAPASSTQSPSRTSSPTAPLASQAPRVLTFKLTPYDPKPGSSVAARGTVTIDIKGFGYTLTVSASGLVPGSQHKLDIHAGSCAAPNGNVTNIVGLYVPADAAGKLLFVSKLLFVREYPDSPWVVPTSGPSSGRLMSLHAEGQVGVSATILCGDLTN